MFNANVLFVFTNVQCGSLFPICKYNSLQILFLSDAEIWQMIIDKCSEVGKTVLVLQNTADPGELDCCKLGTNFEHHHYNRRQCILTMLVPH